MFGVYRECLSAASRRPILRFLHTMFAIAVVLLNALSFASLAYIANRKGYHAMAALAAAGAWLFGATGGVLIWAIWR
jgi:hypothetical protein